MDMAIGISIIALGIILFIFMLIPSIMSLGGGTNLFVKVIVAIVSFGIPIFMVWMGWSIIQGDRFVPLWVGLIPPAVIAGWIGWIFFKREDLSPDKSKILQITPSNVSKIIHENAVVSPGLSASEHKQKIMEVIDNAVVIAKSIQMNNPDYRLPLNKNWPYSLDGIEEIVWVLTGIPLGLHGRKGLPSITKDEVLTLATNSSGSINSNDSTSIAQAISFFKDDSNAPNDSQRMSLKKMTGVFLYSVRLYLYEEDQKKAKH